MHKSVHARVLQCPKRRHLRPSTAHNLYGAMSCTTNQIIHNCCNPDPAKCRGPQKKSNLSCPVLSSPLHTQEGHTTTEGPAPPDPQRTPHDPWGRTPPAHATEARIGRHTDHTGTRPPATGIHTGDGGHTCTGRTCYTHGGSHWDPCRPAQYHAVTARRRPRPPQGPPHKHRKRTKARAQHAGLGTGTPRGHGTTAQAPREGNPTDTYPTHQPERHTRTPTARTQRATHT